MMMNIRSLVTLTLVGLIAACSPSFSTRVEDFSVPIDNTLGQICWVRVDTSRAPSIRAATYRAQAIYDPGSLGATNSVRVQFFGRADDPQGGCTARDETSDVPLSETFELERSASQAIEVGGQAYGAELGQLVNQGIFWLGAVASDNVGINEQLHFKDGRISVTF